jgi:hypothetical protein
MILLLYHPHVLLRQWWEFISHSCEQAADWANTLSAKPLSYALLKEGDTKLNYGVQSVKYTSAIINFKFHAPYLLMQQLHYYSNYLLKNIL